MRVLAAAAALALILAPGRLAAQVTVPPGFRAEVVAGGIAAGTAMAFAPDGRLFVCQQNGALRVIKNGQLLTTPFVTLSVDAAGERGLLGVAFDPAFAANSHVYVYYTAQTTPRRNRVSRFTAAGDLALQGSELVILELEALSATNHNGGAIAFGPDGALYVAVGDNAVSSNAQTLANRLGKILRINADGSLPPDNPFYAQASGANRAIWALGLRNPFTFAFESGTGRMFINDVGQSTYEEINEGLAGANYGWPASEGPTGTPGHTGPVYWYSQDPGANPHGCAITGGAFQRPVYGAFPGAYDGDYFFSDFCGGFILRRDAGTGVVSPFADGIPQPVDLDGGPDGHLYFLARGGGYVGRVRYVRPQLTGLTPASGPPYPTAVPVTWTAVLAPGATGQVEYRFWVHSSISGQWTSTAYGTSNTFPFSPPQPATYTLQVWARNVGSEEPWESYAVSDPFVAGLPALSVTSLTPNQQLPIPAGVPVTWTATATGGQAPYSYQFWVHSAAAGTWSVGRSYATSSSWTWTPPAPGGYALQVWARSAGSANSYDAWLGTGPLQVMAATPSPPSLVATPLLPVSAGTPVTWTAHTTGGREPTQFRFWLYSQRTGVWALAQDWSASASWSWRPSEAGNFVVQVWVRSAGSSADHEAWAGTDWVGVTPAPVTVLGIIPSPPLPVAPGTTVTWEALAKGGEMPLEFKFWHWFGGAWTVLRDYAPSPVATGLLAAGPHLLQVWTRQQGSTADHQAWIGTGPIQVAPSAPSIGSFTATQTFPLPVGTPVRWTAIATGGSAPLEYQFWRFDVDAGTWQVVQPWGPSGVLTWAPPTGTYQLQVWVRSTGAASFEAWAPFGRFSIVP